MRHVLILVALIAAGCGPVSATTDLTLAKLRWSVAACDNELRHPTAQRQAVYCIELKDRIEALRAEIAADERLRDMSRPSPGSFELPSWSLGQWLAWLGIVGSALTVVLGLRFGVARLHRWLHDPATLRGAKDYPRKR